MIMVGLVLIVLFGSALDSRGIWGIVAACGVIAGYVVLWLGIKHQASNSQVANRSISLMANRSNGLYGRRSNGK